MECIWCDQAVNVATEYRPIVRCYEGCSKNIHTTCLAEVIAMMDNPIVSNYFLTLKGCICGLSEE